MNVCQRLKDPKNCFIAADSGTQFNTVPPSVGQAFKEAKVPMMNAIVDCESEHSVGALTYVIGGKEYTFESHEWTEAAPVSFAKKEVHMGLGPKLGNSLV